MNVVPRITPELKTAKDGQVLTGIPDPVINEPVRR